MSAKYAMAVGISIALTVIPGLVRPEHRLAYIISGLAIAVTGIAVGTATFMGMRRWASDRFVSALVSGFVSGIVGMFVGFLIVCPALQIMVVMPSGGLSGGDVGYVWVGIFSGIFTGMVGFVFGAGPSVDAKYRKIQ